VEIARGQISDRPWGQTLGAIGFRGVACELAVYAEDGKEFRVAFDREAIVGAYSPLVADSIIRIGLNCNLITPGHVGVLTKRLAALANEDEIDVIAEACRLDPEQALRLRRRAIAQRAARTFAIDRGTFVLEDQGLLWPRPEAAIDIRAIVLAGSRAFLSEPRLAADLARIGTHFTLRQLAPEDLAQFAFTPEEIPIVDVLRQGIHLSELVRLRGGVDVRTVHAVVYALVSCFACDAATLATGHHVPVARTVTPPSPVRTFTVPARGSEPGFDPAEPLSPDTAANSSGRFPIGTNPPRTRTPSYAGRSDPLLPRTTSETFKTEDGSESRKGDPQFLAAEAFQRGMALLREDSMIDRAIHAFGEATRFEPSNPDYIAMLAWAHFVQAPDKKAVADRTRKALAHAIHKSEKPELAHFYMGRVERILGRFQSALEHFNEVLDQFPRHEEAQAEVRLLRQSIANSSEKSGLSGLFSRIKK
jgi:tetratricopeptide (TPR) repeat protein